MKRCSIYILTFIICAFCLTGCMTEEAPLTADVDLDMVGAQAAVDVIFEPNDIEADGNLADPDVKASDGDIAAEEPAAIPDEHENEHTVTTVYSTVDDQYDQPDTTSDYSVNTTPADLGDSTPTMILNLYNAEAYPYEFEIQNNTKYEWGYGLEPYFDKYDEEQGIWLPVEPITEITVMEIYCLLQPGGSSTYTLPIEQYYGELNGVYRAGLLMRNHNTETSEMIWCEFGVID